MVEWALHAPDATVHLLADERFFRQPVSRTFHGRDVFAPVTAHLARGVALESLGPRINDPVRMERPTCRTAGGVLTGRIAYIDRFGNALTTIMASDLWSAFPALAEEDLSVDAGGRRIRGITYSYGEAPIGTLVAIIGSSNRLEIAHVGGHAALRFGFGVGDPIAVRGDS